MQARALCPSCGQYRDYSCDRAARRAERQGRKCHTCANHKKNLAPRVFGFSEAEFNGIRRLAKRRKKVWDFTLTNLHDLWEQQDGRCAMTGEPMRKAPRSWSLDRIDNACGYVPGNVQLVLKRVNMMRGTLSAEVFVSTCKEISKHRSKYETD